MRLIDWLRLILLSIIWGGSYFFIKIAVAEVPPFTLVLPRVTLAAAVLHLVMLASRQAMPKDWKVWRALLVLGLFGNVVPFSLIFWGETQIDSGLAAVVNATMPLFTVLFAHFLTRDERMTPNKVLGVIVGMAGVLVLVGAEALAGAQGQILGMLAVAAAGASYAYGAIYARRFRQLSPIAMAAGQLTWSAVLVAPLVVVVDQPWNLGPVTLRVGLAVLGLALLSTAIAYLLYFQILKSAGATNVSIVTILIPVSALLLGVGFLGEHLLPHHFIGMALIGLGLVVLDGRLAVRRRRSRAAVDG